MPWKNETGKKLYVNADKSKLVEEDSPEAAFVLAGEGQEIDDELAEKLGLTKKAAAKAEDKAVEGPPENKGRSVPKR